MASKEVFFSFTIEGLILLWLETVCIRFRGTTGTILKMKCSWWQAGGGVLRFRKVGSDNHRIPCQWGELEVVDIPNGYTHQHRELTFLILIRDNLRANYVKKGN